MTTFETILGVITVLLALYGAALSTYLHFRDRAAIKVEVDLALVSGLRGFSDNLVMKAVNIGRRPVHFRSKPSILFDNGYQLVMMDAVIPSGSLNEGEVFEAYIELKELDRALRANGNPRPTAVVFRDSVGRKHTAKLSRKRWANIARHISSA